MGKCKTGSKYFEDRTDIPIWDIVPNTFNLANNLGQMVCLSQKFIVRLKKNCLKVPPCVASVMHDKWMKEWFSKAQVPTLKEFILYLQSLA